MKIKDMDKYVQGYPEILDVYRDELAKHYVAKAKYEEQNERYATQKDVDYKKAINIFAKRRQVLLPQIESIKSGENIDALTELFHIYDEAPPPLYLFKNETPIDRLSKSFGHDLAHAFAVGVEAMVKGPLKYPVAEIVDKDLTSYGLLILTSMNRVYDQSEDEFFALPEDTLKAAVILLCANISMKDERWIAPLAERRPELVKEGLLVYFRAVISEMPDHQSNILHLRLFGAAGASAAMELLKEYPSGTTFFMKNLLLTAWNLGAESELYALAERSLMQKELPPESRVRWAALGMLLDYAGYHERLMKAIDEAPEGVDILAEFLNGFIGLRIGFRLELSAEQIAFLIRVIGAKHFPISVSDFDFDHPRHRVRELLDMLAGIASDDALKAFNLLINDPGLKEWRERIMHAAETQRLGKAEKDAALLALTQVTQALDGLDPANHAHLLSIAVMALRETAEEIKRGNTNSWKAFWDNCGTEGQKAKGENDCRDRLLDLLRPKMERRNIVIDREGSYQRDTRGDIKLTYSPGGDPINIPMEFKLQQNPEIWTAVDEQLIGKYAIDPKAKGFGIFCVFWHGGEYLKAMRLNPTCKKRPSSPEELRQWLEDGIPASHEDKIIIFVIDVTP